MHKKHAFLFALLITILIAINLSILEQTSQKLEIVKISRIIDGDTIELEDGRRIRLLNINTPEKNKPNYNLSIIFLQKFLNSSVQIETKGLGKYGRTLARIYAPEYLNLELVKKGFASKYLVDESELNTFSQAEKKAIQSSLGIWERSPHFNCLKSEIDKIKEKVLLISNCNDINMTSWVLKDESTRHYTFKNIKFGEITLHTEKGIDNGTEIFWNSKTNIWNNDRDALFIFDKQGKIVHYKTYGY